MILVAFKMIIGNRAAFIGAILGVFLAILLISQQSGIFLGLLSRSYRMVTDISLPNLWVIDPSTEGEGLVRPMPKSYLDYVRNIPGIEWAVPINHAELPLTNAAGEYLMAEIYGIDDETFIGAPVLLEGDINQLHRKGGVIIDSRSAQGSLAPLKLGDRMEINGQQAVIVGIGNITPGFFPQPIIFTTNSQFQKYAGSNRLQYIAAKTKKDVNVDQVIHEIGMNPLVIGLSPDQMQWRMAEYFLKTGILINFALSVCLGMIIGFSITGQIFYILTLHNLHYYALIKAIGGTGKMIWQMIIAQALLVGSIGYIFGVGTTLLWGYAIRNTTLTFAFPWQLLLFTGFLGLLICFFTATLSIKKVFKLDPQILMNI